MTLRCSANMARTTEPILDVRDLHIYLTGRAPELVDTEGASEAGSGGFRASADPDSARHRRSRRPRPRPFVDAQRSADSAVRQIVKGISFCLDEGQVLGVFGPSGTGKSMLAYSLVGLVPDKPGVVHGTAWFRGFGTNTPTDIFGDLHDFVAQPRGGPESKSLYGPKDIAAWRRHVEAILRGIRGTQIALVIQGAEAALNPFHTIRHQFLNAAARSGLIASERMQQQIDGLADRLRFSRRDIEKYPHELSGGMCERALLGVALCLDPLLLIADEPTTGLDRSLQADIVELLSDFRKNVFAHREPHRQRSILLISHDLAVMRELADRVIVMYAGQLIDEGPADVTLRGNVQHPVARDLLDVSHEMARTKPPRITSELDRPTSAGACESGGSCERKPQPDYVLRIEGVRYTHSRRWFESREEPRGLFGVDLNIDRGTILGLMGESGSGKTTFARLLLRLSPKPFKGNILVGSPIFEEPKSLAHLSRRELRHYRKHVQKVFQNVGGSLNPGMTVKEIVSEALRLRMRNWGEAIPISERIPALLEQFGLIGKQGAYPSMLSGGERRRVGVLCTLAMKPSLVIADEPFESLDAPLRRLLFDVIRRERRERQTTFVIITHSQSVADALCDRIAIMENGRIVSDTAVCPDTTNGRAIAAAVPLAGEPDQDSTLR